MRCKSATEAVTLRRSMREQNASRDRRSTDPETGVASGIPEAAICVQDIDVQCVLQFTLLNAAGCALHRHTSRVIHRLEWLIVFIWQRPKSCHKFIVISTTFSGDSAGDRQRGSLNLAMQ